MEISEAQKKAKELISQYGDFWPPLSMMARITEEIGELARAMNIKYGGKKSKGESDGREIEEELADVLFTTLAMAEAQGIDLGEVYERKVAKDFEKMKGVYSKDDDTNC
jgi:NTP pyrophosphatase (non-canonical NTP hydrolase)|tara:strand:+ start:448 stop:774 length:327 start_codon:yes stop_codon:yes gene_type:complete